MNVLMIDQAPKHTYFNDPLEKVLEDFFAVTRMDIDKVAADLTILQSFGAIAISGTPIEGYPDEVIVENAQKLSGIERSGKPIVGVCGGHQLLSILFDGDTYESTDEDGLTDIVVAQEANQYDSVGILDDIPKSFAAWSLHGYTATIPRTFRLLATSEKCDNHAMEHETLPIFGFQFHPEYSPPSTGKIILRNFAEITRRTTLQNLPAEIAA